MEEVSGMTMERLFSVEEAAIRLGGLSKYTIHAWLSSGKLRRTKIGSRTMIKESDLQGFITGCNPESSAPCQKMPTEAL
jgi:excisionase family DNA binding protein